MKFREKADYAGHHDPNGIPMLDYRGAIGLQYNPIAIAQWGLANYNIFCETSDDARRQRRSKPPIGWSPTSDRTRTASGSGTITSTGITATR